MQDILKTVTIKTANGPVRINETDFNADEHEVWSDEPAETADGADGGSGEGNSLIEEETPEPLGTVPPVTPAAPVPPSPPRPPLPGLRPLAPAPDVAKPAYATSKIGAKYWVVDASNGAKITDDRLGGKNGYASELDAMAALNTLIGSGSNGG